MTSFHGAHLDRKLVPHNGFGVAQPKASLLEFQVLRAIAVLRPANKVEAAWPLVGLETYSKMQPGKEH